MSNLADITQNLQNLLGNSPMEALNCQQQLGTWSPYYQYPAIVPCCSHAIGPDEELLLNVMRRDPQIKATLLRTALTELLKSMEGK